MPRFANATERPDAVFVYLGKSPAPIENVIVKFPAIAIPNKNIRIFLAIRLFITTTPRRRTNETIKPYNKILFFLKCFISLLRKNIPINTATPNIERKIELILILIFRF
jgi:hypothetical protein